MRGDGVAGRDLDTPTANLDLQDVDLEHGVYAAYATYDDRTYSAIVCYGVGEPPKFEVHLLDFDQDIFGEQLSVEILQKVSELIPWSSKERMRQKILHDVETAKEIFKKRGREE